VLQSVQDHKDALLVLTSFAAVCVSLVTALLAPLVQMRVARLNISATTLVADRVKWIEAMQADIALLLAVTERAEFLDKTLRALRATHPMMSEEQTTEFSRMHQEYEQKTLERNRLNNLVGIKLDVPPEKRDRLFGAISQYIAGTRGIITDANVQTRTMFEVQNALHDIFDYERTRIQTQIGQRWKINT
jgi:hypothetical protein